jgi:hypothetical protein
LKEFSKKQKNLQERPYVAFKACSIGTLQKTFASLQQMSKTLQERVDTPTHTTGSQHSYSF